MTSVEYDLFISHSQDDREWVQDLVSNLSDHGLRVWFDEQIAAGEMYVDRIQDALQKSHNVALVITPRNALSNWVAAELGAALALRKRVIPIIAKETNPQDIPGPLKLRNYLTKNDPKSVAKQIALALASGST